MAYILSAPTIALLGDTVTFMGSGIDADDPDGENNIQSYLWYSSLDGFLSSEAVFSTSSLSLGSHIISLVVTDDEGVTSQAAQLTC